MDLKKKYDIADKESILPSHFTRLEARNVLGMSRSLYAYHVKEGNIVGETKYGIHLIILKSRILGLIKDEKKSITRNEYCTLHNIERIKFNAMFKGNVYKNYRGMVSVFKNKKPHKNT